MNLKLILLLILAILFIFYRPISSFGKTSVDLQDGTGLAKIPEGKTAIFYASWCGHCRASMDEFKAAVQGSDGLVIMIPENQENRKLMKQYNVKSFPTIVNSSGELYNGARKARDIIEFANGK